MADLLLVLLLMHFTADFVLQPECLVERKFKSIGFVFVHAFIYAAVFALMFLFFAPGRAVLPYLIIVVSHCAVDLLKVLLSKKLKSRACDFWFYTIDQLVHLCVICAVYFCFGMHNGAAYLGTCTAITDPSGTVVKILAVILILIVAWRPSSYFIKKLFAYCFTEYVPTGNKESEAANAAKNAALSAAAGKISTEKRYKDPRAGSLIGVLERFIIIVLILADVPTSIGFVLTAKSIARFKNFEEDGFAEKYLVGTFVSVAIAMALAFLIKNVYKF